MKKISLFFVLLMMISISACGANTTESDPSPEVNPPSNDFDNQKPDFDIEDDPSITDEEISTPPSEDITEEFRETNTLFITLHNVPNSFLEQISSNEKFELSNSFSEEIMFDYQEIVFIYNDLEDLQSVVDGIDLPNLEDYSYSVKLNNKLIIIFLNPGPSIRQVDFYKNSLSLTKTLSGIYDLPFSLPLIDRNLKPQNFGSIGIVNYNHGQLEKLNFLPESQQFLFSNSTEALEANIDTYLIIFKYDQDIDYIQQIFEDVVNPGEIFAYQADGKKIILIGLNDANQSGLDFLTSDILNITGRVSFDEYQKLSDGLMFSKKGFVSDPSFVVKVNDIEFSPLDACRIKTYSRHNNNTRTGFPYESPVTKDNGTVRIAVIPLDFPNFPGDSGVLRQLKEDVLRAEAWSQFMTNGDMVYDVVFIEQWVRLPKSSDYYPTYDNAFAGTKQPWQESINQVFNAADSYVDFTDIDFAYFIFPYEALLDSPTLLYGRVNVQTPLAGQIQMAIYGNENINSYLLNSFWSHMVHEVLHFQGFIGHGPCHHCEVSIMTRDNGANKAVLSWEGFLAGWYDEEDVYCLSMDKLITKPEIHLDSLDKLGGSPGYKNVMIPLSDHEVIIIEYRTDGPYSNLPKEQQGILIYVVDSKKTSNYPSPEWVSKITDPSTYWHTLVDKNNWYLFKKGQTITYKSISIEIIDSNVVRLSLNSNE